MDRCVSMRKCEICGVPQNGISCAQLDLDKVAGEKGERGGNALSEPNDPKWQLHVHMPNMGAASVVRHFEITPLSPSMCLLASSSSMSDPG